MTMTCLEALADWLRETVCPKISLRRPLPGDDTGFALCHPAVTIGWPEPVDVMGRCPDSIPGIAIGFAAPATDDGNALRLPVALSFILYSPGTLDAAGVLHYDNTGYCDLCNLTDLTLRELLDADNIGGQMVLSPDPVNWALENVPQGNFWVGSAEFTLLAAPLPRGGAAELN